MDTSTGQADLATTQPVPDPTTPSRLALFEQIVVAFVIAALSLTISIFCLGFVPDLMGFSVSGTYSAPPALTLIPSP